MRPVAIAIADAVGQPPSEMTCARFPDGKVNVQLHQDVRGHDIFVIQLTHSNDFLMEPLEIADVMRRARSVVRLPCAPQPIALMVGGCSKSRRQDGMFGMSLR